MSRQATPHGWGNPRVAKGLGNGVIKIDGTAVVGISLEYNADNQEGR